MNLDVRQVQVPYKRGKPDDKGVRRAMEQWIKRGYIVIGQNEAADTTYLTVQRMGKPKQSLFKVAMIFGVTLTCGILFVAATNPGAFRNTDTGARPVAGTARPTATLTENVTAERIRSLLNTVAGGRDIRTVYVVDGRDNGGTRGVLIGYVTTEANIDAMVEEVFDILIGVGAAIRANDLDLDEVTMLAADVDENTVAIIVVEVEDLLAWLDGDLTRAELVEQMVITDF
jgi:hypothetical protein